MNAYLQSTHILKVHLETKIVNCLYKKDIFLFALYTLLCNGEGGKSEAHLKLIAAMELCGKQTSVLYIRLFKVVSVYLDDSFGH